ncbi:hypothetical protein FQN57_005094 [Myotisia sp. PD_48]|nr:hypothetical protein FQN57_005094 [Myotisia sp. PD_48]
MSDIDAEWKPNGRPQSTMARSLAATLDNVFMLDTDVDHLSNSIHFKKQMVTIQNRELEALEAKIRAAEQRLKQQNGGQDPSSPNGRNSPHRRSGLEGAFDSPNSDKSPNAEAHQSEDSSPTCDDNQTSETKANTPNRGEGAW